MNHQKFCSVEGCTNSYQSHRWGTQKAQNEGWFFSMAENNSYCPEHVPYWVAEWRAKKNNS